MCANKICIVHILLTKFIKFVNHLCFFKYVRKISLFCTRLHLQRSFYTYLYLRKKYFNENILFLDDSSESIHTLLYIGQIFISSTAFMHVCKAVQTCFPFSSVVYILSLYLPAYHTNFAPYFPTDALISFLLSPAYWLGITTAIEQEASGS